MTFDIIINSLENSYQEFIANVPRFLAAILVFSIGLYLTGKIRDLFRDKLLSKTKDPLMANFLLKTIRLIVLIFIGMFTLKIAGLDGIANTILTAAGASAVILGFAFRDIGENFISGIILSFNRPFNIDDVVSIGDVFGRVKSMEFRYTKIKTFDGKDVYIPNSDVVKKPVTNYTEDGRIRLDFTVGIAYENKISDAAPIIKEVLSNQKSVIKSESHEPFFLVDSLNVNTVDLKIFFWVDVEDYRKDALIIKSNIMAELKEAFLKNKIAMPANIQEFKMYSENFTS